MNGRRSSLVATILAIFIVIQTPAAAFAAGQPAPGAAGFSEAGFAAQAAGDATSRGDAATAGEASVVGAVAGAAGADGAAGAAGAAGAVGSSGPAPAAPAAPEPPEPPGAAAAPEPAANEAAAGGAPTADSNSPGEQAADEAAGAAGEQPTAQTPQAADAPGSLTPADAPTATVTMSFADESGYWIAPVATDVSAGLAEQYGYEDAFAGATVSALDVMVAAHIVVFGDEADDIHAALSVGSSGAVTNFMGTGSSNMLCVLNGAVGDSAIPDTAVTSGDRVELFTLYEDWGMDARVWFEADGVRTARAYLATDEPLALTLQATYAFAWGEWGAFDDVADCTDIYLLDVFPPSALLGEVVATTDDNGEFELTFSEPGTYYVSAFGDGNSYEIPIMAPWLEVVVGGQGGAADKTALVEAIAAAGQLLARDYTIESWQELEIALAQAREVAASEDAAQAEVNAALAALNTAIAALERAPQDSGSTVAEPPAYERVEPVLDSALSYLQAQIARSGSELPSDWAICTLADAGKLSAADRVAYLQKLAAQLDALLFDPTDYARLTITLAALGEDPRNFAGRDLTAPLQDMTAIEAQGVNAAIYALLALDSSAQESTGRSTAGMSAQRTIATQGSGIREDAAAVRGELVAYIVSRQLPGGGWNLSALLRGAPDPDTTAMALRALAPYCLGSSADPAAAAAVSRALEILSAIQDTRSAGFGGSMPTSEATAQVALAMVALGIPINDERFVKNGRTVYDALCDYYDTSAGAFRHVPGGPVNGIATEQGAQALLAMLATLEQGAGGGGGGQGGGSGGGSGGSQGGTTGTTGATGTQTVAAIDGTSGSQDADDTTQPTAAASTSAPLSAQPRGTGSDTGAEDALPAQPTPMGDGQQPLFWLLLCGAVVAAAGVAACILLAVRSKRGKRTAA